MISPERLTAALARAQRHWKARQDADSQSDRPKFTIAISRQTGTHGGTIAHEVGRRLGWPVYDRELLQRIADDMGIHRDLLESVDERLESWLSESFWRLFSVPDVRETIYFRRLIETLFSLASHGQCVIVGRGAASVLPSATTLRVRIVAPLEQRIDSVQRENSITRKEAAKRVETTDAERRRFLTTHFGGNPTAPANYDLVLNAGRYSTKECADMIVDALEHLRQHQEAELVPASSGA
jgi:cytidylate kinase